MNCCELAPSFDLAHIVLSYSEFIIGRNAPAPIIHEVIPDGCVSLVYHKNAGDEASWLRVVGPRLVSLKAREAALLSSERSLSCF